MSQNLITMTLTAQQLAAIESALASLEDALAEMISLTPEERKRLTKMGHKSEAFCRQALAVLAHNPQVVPASVDVAGAITDLTALDQLRPLLHRLRKLSERGDDTETALGSDVMYVALEGYALLKVAGKQQGLDGLRRELSARWAKRRGVLVEESEPA